MLLLELDKISSLESQIEILEQSVKNGVLNEADIIAATKLAMTNIEKLRKKYVDKCHKWNQRDLLPRTKSRRGETITYYMTHVKVGKSYKQISASTLDDLYSKLYEIYTVNTPIDRKTTLKQLYEIFLKNRNKDAFEYHTISSQTVRYDENTWNRFFKNSIIADMKVINITQQLIFSEYKRITGSGFITLKSFNRAKSLLNAVFDIAVEGGLIDNNPSRIISNRNLKFKPENNKDKVYTSAERTILIKYISGTKQTVYTLAVRLAFCFCLRVGELTALTWDDYNETDKTLHIWHQIIYTAANNMKRVPVDVPYTKTRTAEGNRYLYVTDEAQKILEELKKINGDKRYILNAKGTDRPITINKFNEHLKKYCENAGIRYLSSHKIRFYGATELFNAGVDPEQIRRIMGHTNLAMTEHYNRTDGKITVNKEIWKSIFDKPE